MNYQLVLFGHELRNKAINGMVLLPVPLLLNFRIRHMLKSEIHDYIKPLVENCQIKIEPLQLSQSWKTELDVQQR